MSILIKGMEMQKDGVYWCEIGVAGEIAMITIHGEDRKSFHLVSVPPHGRLVDADALLADVRAHSESYFADDFAHEWVDVAPTVIPADNDVVEREEKDG